MSDLPVARRELLSAVALSVALGIGSTAGPFTYGTYGIDGYGDEGYGVDTAGQ